MKPNNYLIYHHRKKKGLNMIENIERLYHCYNVNKNITVYEDYEL